MGDWKMVVINGVPHLYNLSEDIHEDTDVAALNPGIVKEMIGIIRDNHTESPLFPVTLPYRQAE
jgi:arylsulfatase